MPSPPPTLLGGVSAAAAAPAARLRFDSDRRFQNRLQHHVDAYFSARGRRPRDVPWMYAKTALILAVFALSYGLLVFASPTWWQGLLLAVVLGIAIAQIGFNIQHDGGHQAYSRHRWINRAMAATLDLIGGSSYVWHWKHTVFHHTYANIAGHDSDIDLGILARLAPAQRRRSFHRWQHIYLWALYGFTALRWHFYGDFRDLITGRIGDRPFPRPRGADLALLIGGKVAFVTLAFVLPLAFHPPGVVALAYLVAVAVTGLLLALVFQLAHLVDGAQFPVPPADTQAMLVPWAVHQVGSTVDFARDNRLLTELTGGLNFQVEHHLFARICHLHYPALAPLVEETCREFGIRYRHHPTLRESVRSHFRWLRQMGRGPD